MELDGRGQGADTNLLLNQIPGSGRHGDGVSPMSPRTPGGNWTLSMTLGVDQDSLVLGQAGLEIATR